MLYKSCCRGIFFHVAIFLNLKAITQASVAHKEKTLSYSSYLLMRSLAINKTNHRFEIFELRNARLLKSALWTGLRRLSRTRFRDRRKSLREPRFFSGPFATHVFEWDAIILKQDLSVNHSLIHVWTIYFPPFSCSSFDLSSTYITKIHNLVHWIDEERQKHQLEGETVVWLISIFFNIFTHSYMATSGENHVSDSGLKRHSSDNWSFLSSANFRVTSTSPTKEVVGVYSTS